MQLRENPGREIRTILVMLAVVALPTLAALATVRVPQSQIHTVDNPTPYGYTVSLLLFLVPVVTVALWHRRNGAHFDRRAFWWCAALMTGLGAFLDLFFGHAFFEFPNRGATLGIRVPAWSWGDLAWVSGFLPLEEFGFYIFGALFMLSVYVWADEDWLRNYDPDLYHRAAQAHPRILQFSPHAVGVWAALVAGGILFRWMGDGGFPGYFVFLMTAGILPSLLLVRTVKRFVNWHALGFAFGALAMISIIWEATLGLPYQWWTYRPEQMLGVYLHAWGNLPLEEVSLWLVGVWDAVMFYELFRILFRMERTTRHALFGMPEA